MLDVRGVHVHAAHDDHVVESAAKTLDPRRRPPAGARIVCDRCDIAGAVAEQRHRLFQESREDELALDAVARAAHLTAGRRPREEVVFVDVEAVAHLEAFGRNAGTAHLGEPVEVDGPESGQRPLDLRRAGPRSTARRRTGRARASTSAGSIPASCTACAITRAYEGVATSTCAPRSWRSIACRAVKLPETGTTGAPIRSAPWWKPWPPVNRP